MTTYIDGGYLSWSYGVNPERHEYWANNRPMYYWKSTGHIFVMDGVSEGHRVAFDPDYKSRRREKRADDPEWMIRTQSVINFRNEILYKDDNLAFIRADGYEADDILAILAHYGPTQPAPVIGVDKDLLQLGDKISLHKLDGSTVTCGDYCNRLPQGLGKFLKTPKHVLLTLAIYGDKSDSVKRLLPLRRLDILSNLYQTAKPFTRAYEIFGEDFLRNLYLVALPGPWCFNPVPTPDQLYNLIRSGKYPGDLKLNPSLQKIVDDVHQLSRLTGHLAIEDEEVRANGSQHTDSGAIGPEGLSDARPSETDSTATASPGLPHQRAGQTRRQPVERPSNHRDHQPQATEIRSEW